MHEVEKEPRGKIRIMFVCLGNICRSPLAEGVFRDKVSREKLDEFFEIRSSGTGPWHAGDGADRRMIETAHRHGVSLEDHCGRQFSKEDLERFDLILVMDRDNLHDVLFLDTEDEYGHKVHLFRSFDPEPECYQVPDPYYGKNDGFEEVYQIVNRTADALLEQLVRIYNLKASSRAA